METGDVYACVDIQCQPALDHPKLKNHIVQQAVAKLGNGGYRGVRSSISLQKLEIAASHRSTGQVWISDDLDGYTNSLWVGWIVAPTMFQDNGRTRLFIHWGDKGTGNWWLYVGDDPVGYWPKGLVPALDDGASNVMWGGRTSGPASENASLMGNGQIPHGDYTRACTSAYMKFVDSNYNLVGAPKGQNINVDCNTNYHLDAFDGFLELGTAILFGGPGGACS
ncbi:hypothetical protein Sjap_004411 [Stephania japonica]|uniref:Neprosin PEP catalytic domain-containing protein n=1 Tax=Stephania japonica TaxID=461633 RepID=A0AAP0K281_9MAGN